MTASHNDHPRALIPPETLGDRLRRLRKHLDLEQAEMADRIHTSRSMIGRWEAGDVTPKLETIQKIVDEFGVDLVWLIRGGVCADCFNSVTNCYGR